MLPAPCLPVISLGTERPPAETLAPSALIVHHSGPLIFPSSRNASYVSEMSQRLEMQSAAGASGVLPSGQPLTFAEARAPRRSPIQFSEIAHRRQQDHLVVYGAFGTAPHYWQPMAVLLPLFPDVKLSPEITVSIGRTSVSPLKASCSCSAISISN